MIGYIAALTAAGLGSAKDIVSKGLSSRVNGGVSAFASFAFAVPFYLILLSVLAFFGQEDFHFGPQFLAFAVARSITDVGAESFKMLALGCGEVSLVTQFLALSPIFLAVTSPLITHDPITFKMVVGLIIITASSLIVAYKPRGKALGPKEKRAILYAVTSAFFFSLNSAFDRLAVQEASATLSAFSMTLFSGLILLPISFFTTGRRKWMAQLGDNKRRFSLRGIFEVLFMVLKMLALQHLTAPVVVVMQRFSVVFTVIAGKLIYKEHDFKKRMAASALIVASAILVIL